MPIVEVMAGAVAILLNSASRSSRLSLFDGAQVKRHNFTACFVVDKGERYITPPLIRVPDTMPSVRAALISDHQRAI